MYTVCNFKKYLLECFLSTSSHFFSVCSATFISSSSCFLASYLSKTLTFFPTYLFFPTCLFALLVSFYRILITSVSSDPFPVHLFTSLFIFFFTALAFFWFLCLHAHHKCFFQNLSQSADLPNFPCFILFGKKSKQIRFEWLDSHSPLSREGKDNNKTPFLLCSLPWNFIFLDWSFYFLKKWIQDLNDWFSYSNSETGTALGSLYKAVLKMTLDVPSCLLNPFQQGHTTGAHLLSISVRNTSPRGEAQTSFPSKKSISPQILRFL